MQDTKVHGLIPLGAGRNNKYIYLKHPTKGFVFFSVTYFLFLFSLLQLKSLKRRQKEDRDRKRENVSDRAQLNHTSLIKPLEHLHRV